jgi:hypothetical protein
MVMCTLLDPKHGDISHVSCLLMHRLLPSLLGMAPPAAAAGGVKKGAAQESSARRSMALNFVLAGFRYGLGCKCIIMCVVGVWVGMMWGGRFG